MLMLSKVTLTKWVKWLKYGIKRDQDAYTILNRISVTVWAICAFRLQNPHQWFLAKQSSLKGWKEMSQKYQKQFGTGNTIWNWSWSQKGCHVINPQNYNFNKFKQGKFWCSQNATNQLKSNVELGYMCPRGNSGLPAVTLTKWLKWYVHARYMKVLSVTVSMFKRRMEMKLGERREKWGALHRLVVTFWDCFTVTVGGLMLLHYMEGGGVSGGPPPEKFW